MPSILVVEQEPQSVDRISAALGAEGWSVRAVPTVDQALRAAAAERPDLVVAGTDLPGFDVLVFSFSRRGGGPGVLALDGRNGEGVPDGVDGQVAKPFTDQQVVLAVRQALLARRPAAAAAAPPLNQMLTSHDIFGDVLAEVESDLPSRPVIAPPRAPVPRPPAAAGPLRRRRGRSAPARKDPLRHAGLRAQAAGGSAARSLRRSGEPGRRASSPPRRIDRRPRRCPAQPDALQPGSRQDQDRPAPGRGAAPAGRRVARAGPGGAPPPPPQAAAAPPPAPPLEGTGVRKGRALGDFDFAELEELAHPTRPGGTSPGTAPRPAAPAPPPAAAAPPPVQAATPPPVTFAPPPALPEPPPLPTGASVAAPAVGCRHPADPRLQRRGERSARRALRPVRAARADRRRRHGRGLEGAHARASRASRRRVAIKRILPHLSDNAEFVEMFLDEAKLAAQLTHPNIVHIYDFGKIERDYYIAMEYVDGKDLGRCSMPAAAEGQPLPLGLRPAHRLARRRRARLRARASGDFEDRELGLVHRDVSPQNVLVTLRRRRQAAATSASPRRSPRRGQTQAGALKGKLQYMSPEQAWGRARRRPLRRLLARHRALRDAHRRAAVHRRQRDVGSRIGAPGADPHAAAGGPLDPPRGGRDRGPRPGDRAQRTASRAPAR